MTKPEDILVVCNCGKPMRFMGEWPVQYPRDPLRSNIEQMYRWCCTECRIPLEGYPRGVPVFVAIPIDQLT